MSKNDISKYIALILRHKPDAIGITLDEHGWANVDDLIAGISKSYNFDGEMLEEIVAEDSKQRYSFNEDHTLIRANQGHSIPVDVELKKVSPPEILFHGSAVKYEQSIDDQGLLPKSRLYVHLSKDYETAENVGKRHGSPVIYKVKAREMEQDGFEFFLSENGVWLTKAVPVEYLVKM
jgi:putative RNA 2'-phosphotransferase